MPTEKELIAALGPSWKWQAATAARQVTGCTHCGAAEGAPCDPFETPQGRALCPARVLDAAAVLYQRKTQERPRPASAPRSAYEVPPTPDATLERMRRRWHDGSLSFKPTDDRERAALMLSVAHDLAAEGLAWVVVVDLDGNHRGVLWGPPYGEGERDAHDYAASVPTSQDARHAPTITPEQQAALDARAERAAADAADLMERLARADPSPPADSLLARAEARRRGSNGGSN